MTTNEFGLCDMVYGHWVEVDVNIYSNNDSDGKYDSFTNLKLNITNCHGCYISMLSESKIYQLKFSN